MAIMLIALMAINVGFLSGCTNQTNPLKTPIVSASANTYSGTAPLTVQFLSSYTNTNGPIDVYQWNFGDGAISQQQNPLHTYTTQGIYNVTLTVGDDHGAKGTTSLTITVWQNNQNELLHQMLIGTWNLDRYTLNGTEQPYYQSSYTYYTDGTMEMNHLYYGHWEIQGGELMETSQAGKSYYYPIEFYADGKGLIRTVENYLFYFSKA